MSKYGVFSGKYFPVFSPSTGKYGPEKTPYLETFHEVTFLENFRGHSDLLYYLRDKKKLEDVQIIIDITEKQFK